MKIQFGNYEIDIKAKCTICENEKFNKQDTMYVINYIGLLANESAKHFAQEGMFALSQQAVTISNEIHEQLKEKGCYKK